MAHTRDEFDGRRDIGLEDLGAASFERLGDKLQDACGAEGPAEDLVRAIECEVLPRLTLIHRDRDAERLDAPRQSLVTPERLEAFVQALLTESAAGAGAMIDELLDQGALIEHLFMDLLAPSARRLGELWDEDACDFSEVTIGLCRLHEMLRHNSVVGETAFRRASAGGRSVLLSNACGDQHVFGLLMVAEFFRRDGWRVWSEPGAGVGDLEGLLGNTPFDIVGLSIARSVDETDLEAEIRTLRAASMNKEVKFILGGNLVAEDRNLVARVGADGCSTEASKAPQAARMLLSGFAPSP